MLYSLYENGALQNGYQQIMKYFNPSSNEFIDGLKGINPNAIGDHLKHPKQEDMLSQLASLLPVNLNDFQFKDVSLWRTELCGVKPCWNQMVKHYWPLLLQHYNYSVVNRYTYMYTPQKEVCLHLYVF